MIMKRWCLILAVGIFICISHPSLQQKRRCFFKVKEMTEQNYRYTLAGNVRGSVQFCENTHCCVAYYLIINGKPKPSVLACDRFEVSCPDPICKAQQRTSDKSFLCACNTDLCNGNITWGTEQTEQTNSYFSVLFMKNVKLLAVILILVCFLIIAAAAAKWRSVRQQKKENLQSHSHDCGDPASCEMTKTSEINISEIELEQIVARGHFATVFQGTYKGSVVAVKVLPEAYEQIFTTEKEIYELPLLKHAGIVNFLGAGRKPDDRSWFIVLQFAEHGSLHSFLSNHTMNWMFSLKLCHSLSQGLSYLHSDLLSHDVHKPPVAHRDLNGFNVLVRADGTCALCDFGCSAILRSSSGCYRWHNQDTHMKIIRLGTLNYVAPEILEDSVNQFNAMFLMQADVYALGLLLWEIWMRCSDLFEGNSTPQHFIPYELELGTNVTMENLIQYVSHMDKRPSIPEHWKLLPQGADLMEIMTDCWDNEADARLTAHTVVDRLIALQSSYSV